MIWVGNVQNLPEIARKLDISADMVLQMAKELTNKGYLQEMGADCDTAQTGCSDCPVNGGCQVIARHWFLTEKGRSYIANQ